MQVKEALIRIKNKLNLLERWQKHQEGKASKVGHTYRAGRPQTTTKVDDRRIISLMKKKTNFTRSSKVKNTLKELSMSLSKSTVKRCLFEHKDDLQHGVNHR